MSRVLSGKQISSPLGLRGAINVLTLVAYRLDSWLPPVWFGCSTRCAGKFLPIRLIC